MQTIRANEQRIKELFTELVSIDSISFSERNMADRLKEILRETGFEVMEDCAGELYGGNAGNVYGFLKERCRDLQHCLWLTWIPCSREYPKSSFP
ncbi:MAG: hypothetical protein ACLTCI_07620 [[Clostridium] nexile]